MKRLSLAHLAAIFQGDGITADGQILDIKLTPPKNKQQLMLERFNRPTKVSKYTPHQGKRECARRLRKMGA